MAFLPFPSADGCTFLSLFSLEKLKFIKHLSINILNFLPYPQHTQIDQSLSSSLLIDQSLYSSLLSFRISEDFYSSCNFD